MSTRRWAIGDRKPSTLAEAVEILRAMHSEEEFAGWAAVPLSDALCTTYFQAGLWIRNKWVHGDCAPLVQRIRELTYFGHDDDVSQLILEALWRVVNSEECRTIEALLAERYPGRLKEPTEPP